MDTVVLLTVGALPLTLLHCLRLLIRHLDPRGTVQTKYIGSNLSARSPRYINPLESAPGQLLFTMADVATVLRSFLNDTTTIELATYLIFLGLVGARATLGHFPRHTLWCAPLGLYGLLQLWLRHSSSSNR